MRSQDQIRETLPGTRDVEQKDRALHALPDARRCEHRAENRSGVGAGARAGTVDRAADIASSDRIALRNVMQSVASPFLIPKSPAALSKERRHQEHPEISWTYVPRIEPGEYPAFSRFSKIYRDKQFKRWVCAIQFDVLNDSLLETVARLTWYLNMGGGDKPRVGLRGNYWPAWVKANGGRPKRNDRLSPRIFERRHAVVLVGDTAKTHHQQPTDKQTCYSVIRDVIRWEEIGAPR